MRNEQFGPAAGSPNWAQGDTRNRFIDYDETIRQSRGELHGEPMMEVLPTWAPYKWAFGPGLYPEEAIATGAGESLERDLWGGFYYGYHPYAEHGYPGAWDNASYVRMPLGYTDPLYDPDQDLWHYSTPTDAMPQVQEREPWHAAVMRHIFRGGGRHHPSRSPAGHGRAMYHHEQIGFHGHGE